MSLLEASMTKCVAINKQTVSDGYGGTTTAWIEGASFMAAIRLDSSMQARIAEQQGVTSLYTIITKKNITLEYHDVLRRVSDGKIFRVTSDGDDKHTPDLAALDMREVSAEEWEMPHE